MTDSENKNVSCETNETYTKDLYAKYQLIFNDMNRVFFEGKGKYKLPAICIAINNRCPTCATAYVSCDGLYDTEQKKKIHYMALNPKYLNRSTEEILATICHELCHVYEIEYIHIPRGGYHTSAWADLMHDCGLEPIFLNTSRTAVSTKITEGGIFEEYASKFIAEHENFFTLIENNEENILRLGLGKDDNDGDGQSIPKADNADKKIKKYNRNKIKYTCKKCGLKMWGKSGLKVKCCTCDMELEEEKQETEPSDSEKSAEN